MELRADVGDDAGVKVLHGGEVVNLAPGAGDIVLDAFDLPDDALDHVVDVAHKFLHVRDVVVDVEELLDDVVYDLLRCHCYHLLSDDVL